MEKHLTPQMSGELLAEIKRLAHERYSELLGTDADFENMWRNAFSITDDKHDTSTDLAQKIQQ
jgi:hypothetical protein